MKLMTLGLSLLILSACTTARESDRFENVNVEEITNETLPKGSRIKLELRDGHTVALVVSHVDKAYIYSTASGKIPKADIKALTVSSWGGANSEARSGLSEGLKDTGVEVLKSLGCLTMVITAGMESDCR